MYKKITVLFCIAFLSIFAQQSFAQDLLKKLPTTDEEFTASEPQVLATIAWLETTPFDDEGIDRLNQKALFLGWITNTPTVTLELNANVMTFTDKNPDLILTFMGGWTRFALENDYSTDNVGGSIAGIRSVIKVYKDQSLKKDKEVEKLIELEAKGELEDWVKEQMKKK